MKRNQKGFTAVELLMTLVLATLIGVVGWYAWQTTKKHRSEPSKSQTTETTEATPYTFQELGITIGILNGWKVKAGRTTEEGVNFYAWTVEKTGADGKIELSSADFRGGFEPCAWTNGPLTMATIREVASTRNSSLLFMSWSYRNEGETLNRTGIVLADEAIFRTTNDSAATAIPNKDVKAGNYFFCTSEPIPGFSLKLNKEDAPGFSRKDSITALSSNSSNTTYMSLSPEAKSYADIKAMLTSVR